MSFERELILTWPEHEKSTKDLVWQSYISNLITSASGVTTNHMPILVMKLQFTRRDVFSHEALLLDPG